MVDQSTVTRRRFLTTGTVAAVGGIAGCSGVLDSDAESEPPGDTETAAGSDYSGPLQVSGIERVDDGGGRTVRVAVTIENTGSEARQADLVVTLSHTEADGSIDRDRSVLLAAGLEREVILSFRPQFFGEDGIDRPEDGEFRFDGTFRNDEVREAYPGLVTPSERAAIDGGSAWPGIAYDPGATAYNPGTEAPRSEPTAAWTESAVEYAFSESGPVVADGTVVAGRSVRALSASDGGEQWVHEGPARTSPLAVGDGVVAFGTPEDVRALEAESGEVQWNVPSDGDIWHGAPCHR
ncbi:PQQ-binding-like beta-propeller repeat protein [Natrinema versiforme]|uniref:Pyrrolo-quinoline quinone repeat domain-containing protein n=1 Tax=Natrinema versiforme TaxID=88724 RepID=A0A4P8WL54_9EURY|nr:PQQ-binding-like beta-propeller repeat protein [Natrinema versiforme]QCS43842.1 hypothetical protein FEJ81_16335 [Natrinema versiforme]